jgi:hypothetical protein
VIFSFNGTVLAGEIKEILEFTISIFFKVHTGEHIYYIGRHEIMDQMINFFENVF